MLIWLWLCMMGLKKEKSKICEMPWFPPLSQEKPWFVVKVCFYVINSNDAYNTRIFVMITRCINYWVLGSLLFSIEFCCHYSYSLAFMWDILRNQIHLLWHRPYEIQRHPTFLAFWKDVMNWFFPQRLGQVFSWTLYNMQLLCEFHMLLRLLCYIQYNCI